MRATPETDGRYNPDKGWTGVVPIEHARKLERERDEARQERNALAEAVRMLHSVKGRYHTEQAAKKLFAMVDPNSTEPFLPGEKEAVAKVVAICEKPCKAGEF